MSEDHNRGTGRTRALLKQALNDPHKNVFFVVRAQELVRYCYDRVNEIISPDYRIVGNRTKMTWTHPDGRVLHIVNSPDKARGYVDTKVIFDHD